MFFTRTHECALTISTEEFKQRLIGKHVKIHNLDFEVMELDSKLNIVPHAEQVNEIKTLPITEIDFKQAGGKTNLIIKSKMRQLDAGGPQLIMIFCLFLFVASIILFVTSDDLKITLTFLGTAVLLISTFWYRMQTGYFDYVRKIREYVVTRIA
ncbi:MAG: hypothetical protein K9G49_11135 [Taibaiella sp.]|nr:hypothetical protein [Taibaiella sp.]